MPALGTGVRETVAPLQGADQVGVSLGGSRYAPTTGYYLTALQAEIRWSRFHTLGSDLVLFGQGTRYARSRWRF